LLPEQKERAMRDFKQEIDLSDDPHELREILADLSDEIEMLENLGYDTRAHLESIHDLELVRRYGEQKIDKLLA
jgi:hypothetical protein